MDVSISVLACSLHLTTSNTVNVSNIQRFLCCLQKPDSSALFCFILLLLPVIKFHFQHPQQLRRGVWSGGHRAKKTRNNADILVDNLISLGVNIFY